MAAKPDSSQASARPECPICLTECDDPQVLPCLHNLCEKCLQEHIETSAQGSRFYCPLCRHQCEVPARGATALPNNALSTSQHAAARPSIDSQVDVEEKECSNNHKDYLQHSTATAFCVECADYLCPNCEASHNQFDGFREHKVLPAGETGGVAVLNDMLGTVSVKQKEVTTVTIPSNMKIALSSLVLSLKPDVDASSLAVIGNCACVTGRSHSATTHLWIHNMKTNTNKRHKLTGIYPCMATIHTHTNSNNTLVMAGFNKELHFITICPQNMDITKHTVKDVPFYPGSVSLDPATGKLIIKDIRSKEFVICDNIGNIEDRVTVIGPIGALWCAVATDDGYIVLGRTRSGRVHWVNKEGKITHSYGHTLLKHLGCGRECCSMDNYLRHHRDEFLKCPRHMIRDSHGRLVVADTYNHRLHLIDVNRQLSHFLLTEKDGIKYPFCICLDETTGRLLVGHRGYESYVNIVSIYRWPFTATPIPSNRKVSLSAPVLSLKPDIGDDVSGLAVIGDCVCVTGWFKPYLWIHNMKTNTNKRHKLAGFQPKGMTNVYGNTNKNNTLVVADHNKKLHFITICPQNMNITKHTVKNTMLQPRNISVDQVTGNLIIANETDSEIVTCDDSGKMEDRVTVMTRIDELCEAVATDDGYVVLGEFNPHPLFPQNKYNSYNMGQSELSTIHWVDKLGKVTHSYRERPDEFHMTPHSMIVDSQGRLIVTEPHNHRLLLIDVNRQLSHYLLTEKDGIKYPCCVYLDETTERLFVGHDDLHDVHTVSVYKWPFSARTSTYNTLSVKMNTYE